MSDVRFTQQDREDMANILCRHGIRVTPKKMTKLLDLLLSAFTLMKALI